MAIVFHVVYHKTTKQVLRFGYECFEGDGSFDPDNETCIHVDPFSFDPTKIYTYDTVEETFEIYGDKFPLEIKEKAVESPDGERVNFSTTKKFISMHIDVYYNGSMTICGCDDCYTEDADLNGITFVGVVPEEGSRVYFVYNTSGLI